MPSSRSSRKGLKWSRVADAHETVMRMDIDTRADPVPWSPEKRLQMQRRRRKLANKFRGLDAQERTKRKAEFRRELRKLCFDDRQFKGAWAAQFERFASTGTPAKKKSKKRKGVSKSTTKTAPVRVRRLGSVSGKAPTDWDERLRVHDARKAKDPTRSTAAD